MKIDFNSSAQQLRNNKDLTPDGQKAKSLKVKGFSLTKLAFPYTISDAGNGLWRTADGRSVVIQTEVFMARFVPPVVVTVYGIPPMIGELVQLTIGSWPELNPEINAVNIEKSHNDRLHDLGMLIATQFCEAFRMNEDSKPEFIVNFPSDRKTDRENCTVYIDIQIPALIGHSHRNDIANEYRIESSVEHLCETLTEKVMTLLHSYTAFKKLDLVLIKVAYNGQEAWDRCKRE